MAGRAVAGTRRGGGEPAGFTLTELLVVIAIVIFLTLALLPGVLGALAERKFSDAARSVQAVLVGARDRAVLASDVRGVRLIRDTVDPWVVSGLVYVGMPEPYSVSLADVGGTTVSVTAAPPQPDPHWEQVQANPGADGIVGTADDIPIPRVDRQGQSYIRFQGTGPFHQITAVDTTSTPARLAIFPPVFTPRTQQRYQIYGPPAPLADTKPTLLPDGVVIDVRSNVLPGYPLAGNPLYDVPRSRGIPNQLPAPVVIAGGDGVYGTADDPPSATWPPLEILFGPTGEVTGAGARTPLIHLWIGERADKAGARTRKLLTLNTRTGAIQVTDNADPNAANPFAPAEQQFGDSSTLGVP